MVHLYEITTKSEGIYLYPKTEMPPKTGFQNLKHPPLTVGIKMWNAI